MDFVLDGSLRSGNGGDGDDTAHGDGGTHERPAIDSEPKSVVHGSTVEVRLATSLINSDPGPCSSRASLENLPNTFAG
ncbi:hypothetical protein C3469_18930 [Mycobacterium kansasii]|nr:hypothetical protein [Mycobacterium kansasii]POX71895.1 hypothetical protein C3475_18670 [Mycobacterium kansasii]POX76770.1 hypothetical protein C3471_20170 [Mycobacterium kansasii]POX85164.1 hypothetical protein C3470_07240 [Mycobacterium kansasii]POX86288.1 hypothetical protein C3B43_19915 [Mycobacterium kansasii]